MVHTVGTHIWYLKTAQNRAKFGVFSGLHQEKRQQTILSVRARNTTDYDTSRARYTKARNKVKALLRKAKRRYERDIGRAAKSNPRAFFGHARRHLKTKRGVAPLLSNPKDKDSMKFKDEEKANILLKQFSSVFTHEKPGEIPRIQNRTSKKIAELEISTEMVLNALLGINVYKSCGPDKLHPRLLKELAELIAFPVAELFKCSLKHGVLPEEWRQAFVTPIYKKGSHNLPENYRPISLTSILCKIMERFIRDHIMNHLLEEKLLSKKQYRFISERSTTLQLLYYLDECMNVTAKG